MGSSPCTSFGACGRTTIKESLRRVLKWTMSWLNPGSSDLNLIGSPNMPLWILLLACAMKRQIRLVFFLSSPWSSAATHSFPWFSFLLLPFGFLVCFCCIRFPLSWCFWYVLVIKRKQNYQPNGVQKPPISTHLPLQKVEKREPIQKIRNIHNF